LYCGDLSNLGDLALLLQNLEHLPGGARAYVRRWAPLPAEVERQVVAAGGTLVDSRRFLPFVKLAATCDIIIGGGQLVRDNVSLASLAAQYAAARAARWSGGRVVTRGLGVGAIRDRKRRWLWGALLRLAPQVRVRDAGSVENAAALVGRSRVVQTADLAFLPGDLHARASRETPARDRILVAPCIDGNERRSMAPDGLAQVLAVARRHRPGDDLVFACHDPRPAMDVAAAESLIRDLAVPDARIVMTFDLDRLLGEYRRASLVVSNRLHAIIFALLADCPILVMDDRTTKTQFVAALFGLPVAYPGDVASTQQAALRALRFVPGSRGNVLKAMAQRALANLA
jgi:polysaccharide pyruvyl transferase WcaK-like protein